MTKGMKYIGSCFSTILSTLLVLYIFACASNLAHFSIIHKSTKIHKIQRQ